MKKEEALSRASTPDPTRTIAQAEGSWGFQEGEEEKQAPSRKVVSRSRGVKKKTASDPRHRRGKAKVESQEALSEAKGLGNLLIDKDLLEQVRMVVRMEGLLGVSSTIKGTVEGIIRDYLAKKRPGLDKALREFMEKG